MAFGSALPGALCFWRRDDRTNALYSRAVSRYTAVAARTGGAYRLHHRADDPGTARSSLRENAWQCRADLLQPRRRTRMASRIPPGPRRQVTVTRRFARREP